MTKYKNLTDEQISSLLCRNEATAGIEVTLPELLSKNSDSPNKSWRTCLYYYFF